MNLTLGLHQVLQQQPERVATWFGDRQRSYREVADRVARIVTVLRECGVGTGDQVAMLAVNSDRLNLRPMAGATVIEVIATLPTKNL